METHVRPRLVDRYNEKELTDDIDRLDALVQRSPRNGDTRAQWTHAFLQQMLCYKRERLKRLREAPSP